MVEDAAVQKAVAWREERQFVPAWRCLREVARAVVRGRVGSKVGGEGKVAPTGEVAAVATAADRVADQCGTCSTGDSGPDSFGQSGSVWESWAGERC